MNKQLLLLFVLMPSLIFAMDPPSNPRKQLVERIVKRDIKFEEAEAFIDAQCNKDAALKAYACVYSQHPRDSEFWGIWASQRQCYLQSLSQQSSGQLTQDAQDVIEIMKKVVDKCFKCENRKFDPFIIAYELKKENVMHFFKSLGHRPQRLTLNAAIDDSNYRVAELLVQAGAEWIVPSDPLHNLQHHPVYRAAMKNDEPMVELLLKSGVDLTQKYCGSESVQRTILEEVQYKAACVPSDKNDPHTRYILQSQKALELLQKYSLGQS